MIRVDETDVPQSDTRAGVRVEGIKAFMLSRDEDHIVLCAADREIGGPQGLRVNRAIRDAGKKVYRMLLR